MEDTAPLHLEDLELFAKRAAHLDELWADAPEPIHIDRQLLALATA